MTSIEIDGRDMNRWYSITSGSSTKGLWTL